MKFFLKIFSDPNKRYLKEAEEMVFGINNLEKKIQVFSNEELKSTARKLKEKVNQEGDFSEDEILIEAFALVREAAKRTLSQRHFDVQLVGGMVLHQGKIAQMQTGEGKTLAATLPAFLNGLAGQGVHIVTVNDYLAKRDAIWMGQIYNLLGLSVGCIAHDAAYLYDPEYRLEKSQTEILDEERDKLGGFKVFEDYLKPCSRKDAYSTDITYGTNNEFGFDYLRDNLVFDIKDKVQRGLNFAIVDEVDSILIDEARTPLIISQPDFESSKMYKEFSRIIPQLKENVDYEIDEKMKVATLSEPGIEKIERILGISNIYAEKGVKYLHHLENGLRARVFFQKDKDYIVKEGKVIIVDEFTGRLLPGRRYSGGLHQAIEAKEGVEVLPESKTLATITFQNYFRIYKKLAGMTGTASTSAEEFDKVYNLEVIEVPTERPMIRQDMKDKVFKNQKGKWKAIVQEVKKRHETHQPVLVGTTSIEKNEYLGALLEREGVRCQILNAKHHEKEGQIIAQAGKLGAVTVATNMAGRGVDIVLSGNPADAKEAEKIRELGGLCVIGTERHEARRIDNQLRGRAGRQGDSGVSEFFLSLEDDILRIFGGDKVKSMMEILKIPEDEPIETKIISSVIEKAQAKVEGMNFDLRKYILEYDDVIAKHRNKVYFLRDEALGKNYSDLKNFFFELIKKEIEKIVDSNYSQESGNFNFERIFEELKVIFPLKEGIDSEMRNFPKKENVLAYLEEITKDLLTEKEKEEGGENFEKILRFVYLKTLDFFWSEHLEEMDYLKDSVKVRAYGGRDPLVEYKTEGHKIFQAMLSLIDFQAARTVFKLTVSVKK